MLKIIRHGNSHAVVIPRPMMSYLGWLPGDAVDVEMRGKLLVLRNMQAHLVKLRSRKGGLAHATARGGAAGRPDPAAGDGVD